MRISDWSSDVCPSDLVRALAQRSADAAKDIKELIGTSSGQVTSGVDLVGRTGQTLDHLVMRIREVRSLVTEISATTESQAANLQQVNSAVGDMDRSPQQNAAMVEQSTAAERSLASEADQLVMGCSEVRSLGTEISATTGSQAAKLQKGNSDVGDM